MTFNKFNIKLAVFWVLSFFFIIFMMPFSVNAAGDEQSPDLYYPIHQNDGAQYGRLVFTEGMISQIESIYDSENNYIFAFYSDTTGGLLNCYVSYTPKSLGGCFYGEIKNDMSHFGLYTIGSTNWNSRLLRFDPNNLNNYQNININNNVFLNLGYNDYSYVSNFQMYNNNNPETQLVILAYSDGDEVLDDDDTIPEGAEKPDFFDYLPEDTTPPTFDNSSVESALGSIFDYLQYETNKISGTISGIAKYLSDCLYWGLQMVINNIRSKIIEMVETIGDKIDAFKNSVDGFLSSINGFLSDIKGFVNYITEPLDLNEVESSLSNSTTYSLINVGSSLKNTYKDYFDNITAPSTLSFSIPYTILTKSGFITFDFGWYADIRDSVLPWIVGFLYMGFGLALFRSFPSIIHGVSGILQKGG